MRVKALSSKGDSEDEQKEENTKYHSRLLQGILKAVWSRVELAYLMME